MKKLIISIIYLSCTLFTYSQNDDKKSVNDFNFESVSNPAFILLDETPTAIETPDNLKSLSVYLANGFSNNNIAIEINPFWAFKTFNYKERSKSYDAYRGIENGKIPVLKNSLRNLTFSIGYVDKEFEGLDAENKALGLGIRSTFFEYYGKNRISKLQKIIRAVDIGSNKQLLKDFREFFIRTGMQDLDIDICDEDNFDQEVEKFYDVADNFLNRNPQYSGYDKESLAKSYFESQCPEVKAFYNNPKEIKPIFRLDGALGYSLLFEENNINTATAHRFGGWFTGNLSLDISKKEEIDEEDKNVNNYLNVLGILKRIDDGFMLDEDQNFTNTKFVDFGIKLELELNKLKFSFEYLERRFDNDSDNDMANEYRRVGNITYQFSEKISIVGGFGKDFQSDNNLVTILGINWGLDLGEGLFSK